RKAYKCRDEDRCCRLSRRQCFSRSTWILLPALRSARQVHRLRGRPRPPPPFRKIRVWSFPAWLHSPVLLTRRLFFLHVFSRVLRERREPAQSIDTPVRVVRVIRGYYPRVSGILAAHFFGCGSAALRPFLQSWR